MEDERRSVTVTIIQLGPARGKDGTVKRNLDLVEKASRNTPDFIVLPELSSTPYFCIVQRARYFKWAEPIPGPYINAVGRIAEEYGCYVLLPLFEKGEGGAYYNSVVVVGPKGEIVDGVLPDGSTVHRYAKVHVPTIKTPTLDTDEKFYFKPGPGHPVFQTPKAKFGVLICYDRRFPEAWRTLALQGAEICFMCSNVPSWSPSQSGTAENLFIAELRTRSLENLMYVVACNKVGFESFEGKKTFFFGKSCITGPTGVVVAKIPSCKPGMLTKKIDLDEVKKARKALPVLEDRKPETYKLS